MSEISELTLTLPHLEGAMRRSRSQNSGSMLWGVYTIWVATLTRLNLKVLTGAPSELKVGWML